MKPCLLLVLPGLAFFGCNKSNSKADLNVNARYIRIIARQYGALPDWHESKGQPSYIFADEISIE